MVNQKKKCPIKQFLIDQFTKRGRLTYKVNCADSAFIVLESLDFCGKFDTKTCVFYAFINVPVKKEIESIIMN